MWHLRLSNLLFLAGCNPGNDILWNVLIHIDSRGWIALSVCFLVAVRFSFSHRVHFVESVKENCVLLLRAVIIERCKNFTTDLNFKFWEKNTTHFLKENHYTITSLKDLWSLCHSWPRQKLRGTQWIEGNTGKENKSLSVVCDKHLLYIGCHNIINHNSCAYSLL